MMNAFGDMANKVKYLVFKIVVMNEFLVAVGVHIEVYSSAVSRVAMPAHTHSRTRLLHASAECVLIVVGPSAVA